MLQIKGARKEYVTGSLTQKALDDVSFNLRDNEFVAVLGQSGSGKTTLLNIIGGLDRYDAGDIIINGVSTKNYSDRDWDSYRNHTIGFVFQSYNLIPHQSILANVELALTISGISRSERRQRATAVLERMGLGEQLHKRPNQMSGGQMQRVAIARALINDPDILLADEPTGALDSETSVQVMELLREVAKDRLVVMVTHNPKLADEYANRTIRLHDGRIVGDSNPFTLDESGLDAPKHGNMGKASMSFATALTLSFNNLRTKKGRTFLTAFAGSIGIIGIAVILSLSNGVNAYIDSIQEETMVSYPITIEARSFDLESIVSVNQELGAGTSSDVSHGLDAVYSDPSDMELVQSAASSIKENNLTEFKEYLDDPGSEIHQYVGGTGIIYSYDVQFDAWAYDPAGRLINTDGSTFSTGDTLSSLSSMSSEDMPMSSTQMEGISLGSDMPMSGLTSLSSGVFEELLPGTDGALVSPALTDNYEVLYGSWPKAKDEVVLALDSNNEVATSTLYKLGLLPSEEYEDILERIDDGEEVEFEQHTWSYAELCEQSFFLIPACDYYTENADGLFNYIAEDEDAPEKLLKDSVELKIVGIIRPLEDAPYAPITGGLGYTRALTDYLIEHTDDSTVVRAQERTPDVNVLNGMSFEPADDAEKIAETVEYLSRLNVSDKAALASNLSLSMPTDGLEGDAPADPAMMMQAVGAAASAAAPTESDLAAMLDTYLQDPADDVMLALYNSAISPGSYDDNMSAFGVVSLDAPASISIYADSFDDKDAITACIEDYNQTVSEKSQISYTDFVGLLMSSITTIINVISYVLIAFVAVSLVVSSIMIGIITYISVLERTREIGILRALGASKGNISQVFNAETFITGLISGALGVGIAYLLLLPTNIVIHMLTGTESVNAALPAIAVAALVCLSMVLSVIAGLIPSRKAARKDPVVALRTE